MQSDRWKELHGKNRITTARRKGAVTSNLFHLFLTPPIVLLWTLEARTKQYNMGATVGWILVKSDPKLFNSEQIIQSLFSRYYIEVGENELNHSDYDKRFNSRNTNCIQLFNTPEFIGISNIRLTESFFQDDNSIVEKYFTFFQKPPLIYVILRHDNPSDYGYCIVENGVIKRSYLSISDGSSKFEKGSPLPHEAAWLDGKWESNFDGIEDIDMGTITNNDTKEKIFISELTGRLLTETNKVFIGCDDWEIDDEVQEWKYFRIFSDYKSLKHWNKPWWKIW